MNPEAADLRSGKPSCDARYQAPNPRRIVLLLGSLAGFQITGEQHTPSFPDAVDFATGGQASFLDCVLKLGIPSEPKAGVLNKRKEPDLSFCLYVLLCSVPGAGC